MKSGQTVYSTSFIQRINLNNKLLQRFATVVWIILWLIGLLVGAEVLSRRFLELPAAAGQRPLQPYLMNGDFYGTAPGQRMEDREGPSAYGYDLAGGMLPVYTFNKTVSSISDRMEFLFQDRADFVHENDNRALRIFIIGGSAAQGTGASTNDQKYYVQLETMLATKLEQPVHVIPAAMGGYISTQERIVMDLAVLPNRPDLIIIFDGFNDAALPAIYGSRPGDPYNLGIQYEEFYTSSIISKKWLINNSHLYSYWFYSSLANTLEEYRQNILDDSNKSKIYAESTASVYLNNITQMTQECHRMAIPCLVFLQPARALTLRNQGIQPTTSIDSLTLKAYDAIRKQAVDLSPEARFIDITSIFDTPGQEDRFLDWVHFDDKGHQQVADIMLPIVLEVLP